jgi:hypothetical protein
MSLLNYPTIAARLVELLPQFDVIGKGLLQDNAVSAETPTET